MIARSAPSSPPAEPVLVGLAAAAGAVVFALSWALLHTGLYAGPRITDTGVYRRYGDAMLAGEVPYRDFALEYPPGALPVFLLPSLGDAARYDTLFGALMLLCGAAAVALVAVALGALGTPPGPLAAAVGLAAVSPLLLGPVVLTRFDLWPAALAAGALAALAGGRPRLGLGVLAAAAAAKLYPLVLLPLAVLHVARRWGRREAFAALGVFAAVCLLVAGPFALLAPGGLAESVTRQTGRPLQVESLGAAVLLVADRLRLYEASVVSSHGSQNLAGALPDALAAGHTVVQALAVLAVWILFARSPRDARSLLVASAAAVTAFVAFGKVLSPQFAIWLVPLVPLVAGRAGLVPGALLAAVLVTTQLWFPGRYWDVVAGQPVVWLVLLRDALLVALFAALAAVTARARGARGSP